MAEPEQERPADPGDRAEPAEPTLAQVAARAGVSPGTVKRWIAMGLVPGYDERWTPAAAAYVRVVARLRARGHTLAEIKRASDAGQLAVGPIENLLGAQRACSRRGQFQSQRNTVQTMADPRNGRGISLGKNEVWLYGVRPFHEQPDGRESSELGNWW